MTGSLQVRNGKYYVVTRMPDILGKSKQKWISTSLPETAGKRKAQQALRRILNELEQSTPSILKKLCSWHG